MNILWIGVMYQKLVEVESHTTGGEPSSASNCEEEMCVAVCFKAPDEFKNAKSEELEKWKWYSRFTKRLQM